MNTLISPSTPLDFDLVARARDGDRDSFGQLVTRHQAAVCGVAYAVCGDFATSEDLAQDSFVAAWEQLPELAEPGRFRAWVCGIARLLSLNHVRRRTRRGDRPLATDASASTEPVAAEPSPRDLAVSDEEKALLWRTLDHLPENYREPLVLFYREQQSVAAVAAALELAEDTVKQRLSRGRALLREELARTLEGVLARTRPGSAFTLAVLSALPPALGLAGAALSAGTAEAASAGGAFAAAGAGGGAAGAGGSSGGGVATAATATTLSLASLVSGVIGLAGIYVAIRYWRSDAVAPAMRREFWRLLAIGGIVAAVLGGTVAWIVVTEGRPLLAVGMSPAAVLAGLLLGLLSVQAALTVRAVRRLRALGLTGPAAWTGTQRGDTAVFTRSRRWQSRATFAGLPLVSLAVGADTARGEVRGIARGWIAIGDVAWGGLAAVGSIAVAPLALGGLALGGITLGGAAVGGLALGGVALGGMACGGLAAAWSLAVGGFAVAAEVAIGGLAVARDTALGGAAFATHANDATAQALLQQPSLASWALAAAPHAGWLSLVAVPGLVLTWRQLRAARRDAR